MTITSTALALGSWSIKLKQVTPQAIIDSLAYLGHVAVSTGRPDPRVSGDSLLTSARYVGVLRKLTHQREGVNLSGAGMAYWLGDENKKGPVITNQLLYTAQPFTTVVNDLLAQGNSAHAGTINAVAGAYTGYHQYVTIREALTFVCATMTSDTLNPVEFRVNGDGTVDAGTASQLYPAHTTPSTAIVRRAQGVDMGVRALPGKASADEDVTDYATRVILLGQGSGLGIASAEVHLDPAVVPYKDLFGNKVVIARTVSQSSTNAANSIVQAQLALDQYAKPRSAVTLSTDQFDIEGDLNVGDSVWVHDPDAGLVDVSPTPNELIFRGDRINPVKLRVNELTWPVAAGMSVAYRNPDGVWIDLTDYVVFESGSTSVVVGGYDRSLTNPTGRQEALGDRGAPNTSIPATPAFTVPFVQSVYQSQSSGVTKAQVQVRWTIPANTDGSSIIDGDHFEIRYRTSDHQIFPATWAQVAGKTWAQLATQTWEQPIGYIPGPWTTVFAPFDTTSLLIGELTPGVPYDFQIRAVDIGVPPNYSAFSATTSIQTNADTIPPATPAAASVASSLIAVQITHLLGRSDGGTFNLDADLHHLEVHAQYEPTYTPDASTLIGKLLANQGMMASQTAVVGTFAIASTDNVYIKIIAVDEAGNTSSASTATQSSAQLIDDSHISNLTVSKLLAGTITSDWILGASIQTASSGVRTGLNSNGFFAYDAAGNRTFFVDAATGDTTMIGTVRTGLPLTARVEVAGATNDIRFFPTADARSSRIYSYVPSNYPNDLALELRALDGTGTFFVARHFLLPDVQAMVVSPIGAGGDLVSTSSIAVTSSAAVLTASSVAGPAPFTTASQSDRAKIILDGSGSIIATTYGGSGAETNLQIGQTGYFQEVRTGASRDGGFLWLNRSSDSYFGRNTVAGIDAYVRVTTTGDLYLHGNSGRTVFVDNTDLNCTGSARINVPRISNNANGINLEARSGGDVFFYWSGGTLNIGNTAANTFIKTFVIDHPTEPDRWLVHGATESPQAGVEYWGEVEIAEHEAVVVLPAYFEGLCAGDRRQVQVSVVLPDTPPDAPPSLGPLQGPVQFGEALPLDVPRLPDHALAHTVAASVPRDGRFRIACSGPDGTRVAWLVKARRGDVPPLVTEPPRSAVNVHGDGPYRYLTPKTAA